MFDAMNLNPVLDNRAPQLVGIGSIMTMVPQNFAGIVWTTGCMFNHPVPMRHARILAVRGALTLAHIGRTQKTGADANIVLADGGLLASEIWPAPIPAPTRRYALAIAPHYVDYAWVRDNCTALCARDDVVLIDMLCTDAVGDILTRTFAACDTVISSSLHGLVLADAYGVPNAHFSVPTSGAIAGSGFKFRDYRSAFGLDAHDVFKLDAHTTLERAIAMVRSSIQVPADAVRQKQAELRATIEQLRQIQIQEK